jgi:hypothetical protein
LEGIDRRDLGADHQAHTVGVWEIPTSRYPEREFAGFSRSKALELGSSVVKHLRWFLNAIFKLAMSDGLILNNPAMEVYTSSDLEQKREAVKKLEAAVHRAAVSVSGPTLTE